MSYDPFASVRLGSINSSKAHVRYNVSCEKCKHTYCLICEYNQNGCPRCRERHFVDPNFQEKKRGRR
jgi:hypothetical protein